MLRPPIPPPVAPIVPMAIPITSAGAPVEPGIPMPTLHVSNLNEHIHPRHMIAELKKIFSPFGQIYGVTCKRKLHLKGQVFITFSGQAEATRALDNLQARTIYGKSMVVKYARSPSNATIRSNAKDNGKSQKLAIKEARQDRKRMKAERARYPRMTKKQRHAQMMAAASMGAAQMAMMMPNGPLMSSGSLELPNKTLYLQNVPPDATDVELNDLFKRYIGFKELRRVPNLLEIAFVEYETELQAGVVKSALDRHEMRVGRPLRVSFAKR